MDGAGHSVTEFWTGHSPARGFSKYTEITRMTGAKEMRRNHFSTLFHSIGKKKDKISKGNTLDSLINRNRGRYTLIQSRKQAQK